MFVRYSFGAAEGDDHVSASLTKTGPTTLAGVAYRIYGFQKLATQIRTTEVEQRQ